MRAETTKREAELLAELQHRVRNTLARTRAIVRRSAETSESLEDYVAHLDGRLAALARVQNTAIIDPTAGIDLSILVLDEIASASLGPSSQVQADGPTILIHPRAAEPLVLAIHELMTNALKFGALSMSRGRLAISWRIEGGNDVVRRMIFEWQETGLQLAQVNARRHGFGTVVLKEMLKHDLGARTELRFQSDGLDCQIVVPLTERVLP